MRVTFNPQISFRQATNDSDSVITNPITDNLPAQKPQTTAKGVLANIAYAWVNLAEGAKGFIKGIFYGALAGTLVAGANMLYSGIKKYKANKDFKLKYILNRKKAMSKTGKFLAPAVAGVVFVSNLVLAKLKANQRTANVDHMLYEGHRDK